MAESTVIRTVSLRTQAPFVTVQMKEYTPAFVNPLTFVFGLDGEAMVAADVVVQRPIAGAGLLPDKLVVAP